MHWVVLATATQQDELSGKFSPNAKIDWISEPELFNAYKADVYFDLTFENTARRKQLLQHLNGCLILNSVSYTTADINLECIRINGWPGFLKNDIWEIAGNRDLITEELKNDLTATLKWVEDVPGFVSARIIGMLVNEAFMTNEERISSREDIDVAMKTGTNYPYGPFEWARLIGTENILQLLQRLSLQDARYTPTPSLISEA